MRSKSISTSISVLMLQLLVLENRLSYIVVLATSQDGNLVFNMCTKNETISVQLTSKYDGTGVSCQCQTSPAADLHKEDYVYTPGIGSHRFHTEAKPWNEARRICYDEGAHLAIINSKAEEAKLLDMMRKSESLVRGSTNGEEALLGIHDLYKEADWVTIFGEPLASTGYAGWSLTYWNGQPDNRDNRQHCGALINQGGLDDVDCTDKFAFFCELPLAC
ncbi:hemolymph lipopolysaccharide-binding protein-like [Trichogramma pretiosum]|uniref:hemolymph lipopolysaccharide-binding protein-like n=1 Tax=Trichogramma pretiosum TaxID=7493 RepID=UPI0006C9CFBE|nr:hemolymph lipopolysaccharide-binding protein-like [Trichogramma pretiosum]XP_023318378.1 hemolymph lipopolysaccharide-binding protein-like [Trichogramma pretiosum]